MAKRKFDPHWMEQAFANSHGQFRGKAEKAGKSTKALAEEKKGAPGKTGKQARLVLVGMKAQKKGVSTRAHAKADKEAPGKTGKQARLVLIGMIASKAKRRKALRGSERESLKSLYRTGQY